MTIRITTLDNRLRIITDPMHTVETTSVGAWVEVGVRVRRRGDPSSHRFPAGAPSALRPTVACVKTKKQDDTANGRWTAGDALIFDARLGHRATLNSDFQTNPVLMKLKAFRSMFFE